MVYLIFVPSNDEGLVVLTIDSDGNFELPLPKHHTQASSSIPVSQEKMVDKVNQAHSKELVDVSNDMSNYDELFLESNLNPNEKE